MVEADEVAAMCKNRYFNSMQGWNVVPGSSVEIEQCQVSGAMPPEARADQDHT
jgi:hypothetical protein